MTEPEELLEDATQVATRSLPEGALFVAPDGTIYQVILAGSAGFRKAKRWGGSDQEAVALVPDSPLAYHYPVVERGIPLPRPTRADLTGPHGEISHFIFPDEKLARAAALLDETLAWQAGCMARQGEDCWILTDGLHQFRVYHYERAEDGRHLDLDNRFEAENIRALPHGEGPTYWAYLARAAQIEEASRLTTEPAIDSKPSTPAVTATRRAEPPRASVQKGEKMVLSIDIGYGYTKGIGPDGLRFSFPSVIGNAEDITFTSDLIASQAGPMVRFAGRRFFYGEQALLQSRLRTAIFDRSRIQDDTYRLLFAAALAEVSQQLPDGASLGTDLKVVTGLPVGFFSDRDEVVLSLTGDYQLETDVSVSFGVEKVFVVPQPFGSLFRELLNEDGMISNMDVETGRVAVVDVGTFTVDFIVADALRYVQRFSSSIPTGWIEVVNNVQRTLSDRYRLDLTPHEVDKAIRSGSVRVKGRPVDLGALLTPAMHDLETTVVAKARDLWGEGATLDLILVTGGAAEHLADSLRAVYPQARLVPDAFWANAEGFYRFGRRPATFDER